MKVLKLVLTFLFGVLMILGGVNHFLNPTGYFVLIPDFLPKDTVNYATGIIEAGLGVGVFIPRFRLRAAFGIFLLMCIFLPLHVWDATRENPAMGSQLAAIGRVALQLLLICWAWFISRKN